MKVKVKFLKDYSYSPDGILAIEVNKGDVIELSKNKANIYIEAGAVEEVKPKKKESKAEEKARLKAEKEAEEKAKLDAEENK